MLGIVDRNGYTYFGRTNHVDRSLVTFKDFEYFTQETMSKQHTAGLDFDSCDIILCSYCLDFAFLRIVGDECTRSRGIHCIEQTHGDVSILGRLDTGRVQDFCTEVCQLGCLFKMKMAHGRGLVHNTRVVVVHTVDVRPNLDFGSIDSRTYQRSGIIAAATLQIVYLAIGVAADKTLCDINVGIGMQLKLNLKFFFDVNRIRFSILVRTHIF